MNIGTKLVLLLITATGIVAAAEYYALRTINHPISFEVLALTVAPLLSALGIGMLMSYNVSKNIKKLTHTIEDISKGKLDVHVAGKNRQDEIGELARAFDRILVSLKLAVEKVGLKKEELKLGEALEAKEIAEHLKREAEERYKVLAQTSPDCITLLDKQGKVVFMNSSGLKEHGFKQLSQAVGKDYLASAMKDEYREQGKHALTNALKGKTTTLEVQHRTIGAPEWSLDTYTPVKSEKEEITHILVLSRNITKLKKTESQLVTQRNFVQEMITGAGVPIIAFDNHGKLLLTNKTLTKLTGYEHIATKQNWLETAFPTEAREKVAKAISDVQRGQAVTDFVTPLRCKDGRDIIVVSNISPIKDEKNNITGTVMFMRDLSEIFTLEQQIMHWASQDLRKPANIEITNHKS
ncbi:PAS domain S-box protein [Candidatus Woesearchaeota archaeon]|nr:PAS domain S-box protein [Candidatus Woesearchaeota archaeon]